MRLLKQALIGIIAFGILLFLISLLLSPRISVSKAVLVSASKDKVIARLMDISDWKSWNPLLQDPSLTYSFPSASAVQWKTADGKTNAIRLEQYAPDSIFMNVTTDNIPSFHSGFTVVAAPDVPAMVKVEWWMIEELKWYPWEKFYGLFSESLRETYLDNTLQSFKRYMEDHPASRPPGAQ